MDVARQLMTAGLEISSRDKNDPVFVANGNGMMGSRDIEPHIRTNCMPAFNANRN